MTRLLDTDVCIAVLRGLDPLAETRIRAMPEVLVSTVTLAELTYGAARSSSPDSNLSAVESFAEVVTLVDLDADAARHSGQIRADLAREGTPIGGYDLLVAGIARSRDLTLVTGNHREFRRVPGLRVEEW